MPTSPKHAVRLTAPPETSTQSRGRKQFNTLVKKLEAERARLALWRDAAPEIRAFADSELAPILQALHERSRQLILRLDQVSLEHKLTRKEREKLSDFIRNCAMDMLQGGDADDSIQEIYDRHSAAGLDLDPAMGGDFIREMVGAATGLELDAGADLSSPAAIFKAMREKMEEEVDAIMDEAAAPVRPAKRGARAARQEAEENRVRQSVREIFRKLASTLHPDRETDPAERTRKTALMQRANAAYAAHDLLGLLGLQLEVSQIDQADLDNLDDARIAQYNRILTGQVKEIQAEIAAFAAALAFSCGWDERHHRTPAEMLRDMRADSITLRADVADITAQMERFADIKAVKAWLKHMQSAPSDPGFGNPFG